MKTILYLTDLYYKANGREYYKEDLYITGKLKDHFNILIAHPQQAISYLDLADLIVFRNTGSVLNYQSYFDLFVERVKQHNILTSNSFDGKADIKGKQYLLDLTLLGYQVIPTIESIKEIERIGDFQKYVVKLKNGADSIGLEFLTKEELFELNPVDKLIQPYIDFQYEVSFYFLNNAFAYALYAPDKQKRWELKQYTPSESDLSFALEFIKWNNIKAGITRVDACRTKQGELLLVELEDLNPFLSIDLLSEQTRDRFISDFIDLLTDQISSKDS
ncbi:hypothetical protein ACYSNV_04045 [Myroides sp. LJL119]